MLEFCKQTEGFYLKVFTSSHESFKQLIECLPWMSVLCSNAGAGLVLSAVTNTVTWITSIFCRDIFEKVIHLNLAPKKMKFFFKRYLDYEKKYGTEETILAVKTAALEYVEAKSSLADA